MALRFCYIFGILVVQMDLNHPIRLRATIFLLVLGNHRFLASLNHMYVFSLF